jgi:hypothetical protein
LQQADLHPKGEGGDAEEGGEARQVRQREQLRRRRRHAETSETTHCDGQQANADHDEADARDDCQAAKIAHERQRHEAHAAQQHQRAVAAERQLHVRLHQMSRLHLHRRAHASQQHADRDVKQEDTAIAKCAMRDRRVPSARAARLRIGQRLVRLQKLT